MIAMIAYFTDAYIFLGPHVFFMVESWGLKIYEK